MGESDLKDLKDLTEAIKTENISEVKRILDQEQEYVLIDLDIFILAFQRGNLPIISLLIENVEDWGDLSWEISLYLVRGRYFKILSHLANDFFQHIIEASIEVDDLEIIKLIFENKSLDEIDDPDIILCRAIEKERLEIIQFFLDSGMGISEYCLAEAIKIKNLSLLKELYPFAKLESLGAFLIKTASEVGEIKILKFLVEKKNVIDDDALIGAVKKGHLGIVQYLLNIKAPTNKNVLVEAVKNWNSKIVEMLLNNKVPISQESLEEAVKRGSLKLVKYILEYFEYSGQKINEYPMTLASTVGNEEITKVLIEHKSPVNSFALLKASEYGNKEIVKLLINYNAPIDEYAIPRAVKNGHEEIAKILAKYISKE